MLKPNQYTLAQKDGLYGLHRFRDGELFLVKQHHCGEWQTIRRASEHEIETFKRLGVAERKHSGEGH